jgi:cysteine desulfurase / selenocysteine lyase
MLERMDFDVEGVRKDFPALEQKIHGKPLVYLDNAATSQKPMAVINAITRFYMEDCSNIHRGVHSLSERATRDYENARIKVQKFLNAKDVKEIVFVKGTTEAINLVAQTFGRKFIAAGDEILISAMEHHSNIVPWQILCEEKSARLKVIPMSQSGELSINEYQKLLSPRTKLVSLAHVSNALGTINPVKEFTEIAHRQGIPVFIDGAQAVPHMAVDVQAIGCDFYSFSGHKVYGPTGIGVLYGKQKWLEEMPPYQGGGDMISSVTFEKTTYNAIPYKFEAGTPNISGVIGLGAALDYVTSKNIEKISQYESELMTYAISRMKNIPDIRIVGTPTHHGSVLSFMIADVHPHDVGTLLDQEGIAIRTGHHCAQPIMDFFEIPATCRASFAMYNTKGEVDLLVKGVERVKEVFS